MMRVGKQVLFVLLPGVLLCSGCSREAGISASRSNRLVRAAPDWGPQSEGVQCRLRPTKRLWQKGERPTFKCDLRNRGSRLFAFDIREPIGPSRISVDGRWFHRRRDETNQAKMRPLAPNAEFTDLMLSVPSEMELPLGPGRHTIQVAFDLEDLTVVSNPVEIEITTAPAGSQQP